MSFIQLYLCAIVERNPTGAAFEQSPSGISALTGLHFRDGKHACPGELSCVGIVRSGAFTDVQIGNVNFHLERCNRSAFL